jgi:hypothetical protein
MVYRKLDTPQRNMYSAHGLVVMYSRLYVDCNGLSKREGQGERKNIGKVVGRERNKKTGINQGGSK